MSAPISQPSRPGYHLSGLLPFRPALSPENCTFSWFFWLAVIGFIVGVYTLLTVIAIARQVEGIGWVICLNTIPVGWSAALIWACLMRAESLTNAS